MQLSLHIHSIGVNVFPDGHVQIVPPLGQGEAQHLSRETSLVFLEDCAVQEFQGYHFSLMPGVSQHLDQFSPPVQAYFRLGV